MAGLAFERKPWKPPPLADPTQEVEQVAGDYAHEIRNDIKTKGAARSKALFEEWRERSMRHRQKPTPMKERAVEEANQQSRARRLGKATADEWKNTQVHYYTATLGGREDDDDKAIDLGDGMVGVRAGEVSVSRLDEH